MKLIRKIGPGFIFLTLPLLLLVNSAYLELYPLSISYDTEQGFEDTTSVEAGTEEEDSPQHYLSSLSLDAVVLSVSLVWSPFTFEWISFDFPEIIDLSIYENEAPRRIPEICTICCRIIQINAP